VQTPQSLIAGIVGSLIGWIAWASLTYLIGTRLLPEPQTRANVGELLRTIAFASVPGFLRVLGVIPLLGLTIYAIGSIWMLLAMIVAVRQALDYKSTSRAVGVCVVEWALSLVVAAVIGIIFAPTVS
jgi:Yip1 domain